VISFNPDGSGVLISDVNYEIRQPFSAGLSPQDILSLKTTFDRINAYKGPQHMTNVVQFGADYLAAVKNLVNDLETVRTLQDRVSQDSTLFAGYLASPGARTDLQIADLQAASSSIVQLLFAFDSGAPTQKSELFKLL
jgi:hypothetical protein